MECNLNEVVKLTKDAQEAFVGIVQRGLAEVPGDYISIELADAICRNGEGGLDDRVQLSGLVLPRHTLQTEIPHKLKGQINRSINATLRAVLLYKYGEPFMTSQYDKASLQDLRRGYYLPKNVGAGIKLLPFATHCFRRLPVIDHE